MMLFSILSKTWPITFSSALTGVLSTIIIVRFLGPAPFANYAIDLAKLSLLVLVAEVIPSPFSIFQQQRSQEFKDALVYYYFIAAIGAFPLVFLLEQLSVFTCFTSWIYVYAFCLVVQRYIDCRLQAEGRTKAFFLLILVMNITRIPVLLFSVHYFQNTNPASIIWGSLSIGAIVSLLFFWASMKDEIQSLDLTRYAFALSNLWQLRGEYYAYYPNIVLKRLRDTAMPLVCDMFVPVRAEAGLYLLAYRGVQAVCGQLRVIEAVLSNFTLRRKLATGRKKSMIVVAVVGQFAAGMASLILAGQVGVDHTTVVLAVVSSFYIYPYVAELTARSDSYSTFKPHHVTISLSVFIFGIVVVIGIATQITCLNAIVLVLAQLFGQTLAAISYRFFK